MLNVSTILKYPLLVLLSTGKKSFENMGRFIRKSGDTVSRLLQPTSTSFACAQKIALEMFKGRKKLFITIDDTLVKKIYSQFMQGAGMFYDTKLGKRIMAYRLVIGLISDGKFAIPIDCAYLFSKELLDQLETKFQTKEEIAQAIIATAMKLFPGVKMIVLADGLYATVNFLTWCENNKIPAEVRMHSNRVVEFKGKRIDLKTLAFKKGFRPKGRQMARTISAKWHGINLEITIVRRFDKKDRESIVFQAATYKALPREHVTHYKKRWPIEKVIRTTKQHLGLQECFSRKLEKQHCHVASVFLAYSLAQVEMKRLRLKTPEEAIRLLKTKKYNSLNESFMQRNQIFWNAHA
jgi:hypothetical protein